jgi:hypothetical protein
VTRAEHDDLLAERLAALLVAAYARRTTVQELSSPTPARVRAQDEDESASIVHQRAG